MANPRIYGALAHCPGNRVAAIVMHPTSNFLGHYLLQPLAAGGVDTLGLNSRYVANDSTLVMERVIQDVGAGVKALRERGYNKVFLIGNSGGAGLMAFYQAQAEKLTIKATPAGDSVALERGQLPAADGIAICAGHLGRPLLLTGLIDPSVIDEHDAVAANPALNIYDLDTPNPFSKEFIEKYRVAQRQRMRQITQRVRTRLAYVRDSDIANDEAFVVYRTYADPRYLDVTLDANDRKPGGTHRGADARKMNYGPNTLGRFCTLTSWLSQWSPDSAAQGPADLARTTIPVLQLEYTGDGSVFPSAIQAWAEAAQGRLTSRRIEGANHYLKGQPEALAQVVQELSAWMC
jgi:pimeloyl-ACP methyl ester carboxylesterase